jgi:hypothetical protein
MAETRPSLEHAAFQEKYFGYQPEMSTEYLKTTLPIKEGLSQKEFVQLLRDEMLAAHRAGDIKLPAETIRYINADETAINAFLEKNAAEFAESNPFLWDKTPLKLSQDVWRRELGFSSGTHEVMPKDIINVGKLAKLIMENAAKKINSGIIK